MLLTINLPDSGGRVVPYTLSEPGRFAAPAPGGGPYEAKPESWDIAQ